MSTHGSFFQDVVRDLTSSRGHLRLFLQPTIAAIVGARLGIADKRAGEGPFVARLFRGGRAGHLVKESLSDVVVPICVAIVLDAIVQHYELGYVRPLGAIFVGILLVWLPYATARGLANRLARSRTPRVPAG
jgi:hypothetical protein